jgi:hypothetical protein
MFIGTNSDGIATKQVCRTLVLRNREPRLDPAFTKPSALKSHIVKLAKNRLFLGLLFGLLASEELIPEGTLGLVVSLGFGMFEGSHIKAASGADVFLRRYMKLASRAEIILHKSPLSYSQYNTRNQGWERFLILDGRFTQFFTRA